MELSKQEKIRMLGEKETYKYSGVLNADNITQVKMKEFFLKKVSKKNQKATRSQNI